MEQPVIIVDDDPGVLFLHELMVRESGLSDEIKPFNRAESAIKYIDSLPPDQRLLVLLDINMPGMNGWDFMDHISGKKEYQHVDVAMVTSSVNKSDRIRSENYSQIIRFLEKPVSVEDCKALRSLG